MSRAVAIFDLFTVMAAALFAVMPEFSRAAILFGVTVGPDFRHTDRGKALLRRYRLSITAAMLVLLALSAVPGLSRFLRPWGIGAMGLAGISCWIQSSRRTRAFAQPSDSVRVATLSPQRPPLPGGLLFVLGPFLIFAGAAAYLYLNWALIPASFPIHWRIDGTPDGFGHRTVMGVCGLLFVGLGVVTTTVGAACATYRFTRNAAGDEQTGDNNRFKRAMFFVMLLVSYLVAVLFSVLATRPVWTPDVTRGSPLAPPLTMVGVFAVEMILLIYVFRAARARGRSGDGTPDDRWRWGMFYYNPDDAALLVEKRVGIGWTLNYAHKLAWVLLALMLLPAVLTMLVVALAK